MIRVDQVSKIFNKNQDSEIKVFDQFSFEFETGKCTAIIGPNGCGKSTLMNMIAGAIPADEGRFYIEGVDVSKFSEQKRAAYIGRVYQDPSLGVSPSLTILENMSIADKKGEKFGLGRLVKKSRLEVYREHLAELDLGLENMLNAKVKNLSGGQRQSLSLIMAALKSPEVLLLDEHTAALDPKTSKMIMEKTADLISKHKITTVMISHNIRDAIEYSDRIIMLKAGKLVLNKPSNQIDESEIINIYKRSI